MIKQILKNMTALTFEMRDLADALNTEACFTKHAQLKFDVTENTKL